MPGSKGELTETAISNVYSGPDTSLEVLVIYTGGTIGMTRNIKEALVPAPNVFMNVIRGDPQLHDAEFADTFLEQNSLAFALPNARGLRRVLYTVLEYDCLLDSSNMTMGDWSRIAQDIYENYEKFNGFVVLHGTDTITYTASALSFMLENLGKSVILTGAQIPLFESRSDGRNNFVSSILLAGNYVIPEVTIFFNHKLYRGNRTMKISTDSFAAFKSYNITPLATGGLSFEVDYRSILWPNELAKFTVHKKLSSNVGLLRMFPSISVAMVKAFLQAPTEGVVIQSYGAGNMPSNRSDLVQAMKEATERGVIIVNCTQCLMGRVSDAYETGKIFSDAGVISGADMTPEAALTKLAYVLSKEEWNVNTKRQMMSENLRGELTANKVINNLPETNLIDSVAKTLNLTAHYEKEQLKTIIYPGLISAAVLNDNVKKLEELMINGVEINIGNDDLRTPLHIACVLGNVKMVRFLLSHGACVHVKDRYGQTPLTDAVHYDHHEIIELLRSNGAHLLPNQADTAFSICKAAGKGLLRRLQSFQLAGANLNVPDSDGRTALHHAVLHKKNNTVQFLLEAGLDTSAKDILGITPINIAKTLDDMHMLGLLTK